jgi:hypothetical protein
VPAAQAALAALRAKGVPAVRGRLEELLETRVCFMAQIAAPDGNRLWLRQRKDGSAGQPRPAAHTGRRCASCPVAVDVPALPRPSRDTPEPEAPTTQCV